MIQERSVRFWTERLFMAGLIYISSYSVNRLCQLIG